MKYPSRFVAMAFLVVVCACGIYIKVKYLASNSYPPTKACEVFTTTKPDRPYVELAILEVGEDVFGASQIDAAKKKAMQLGADAIILTGTRVNGAIEVSPGIVGTTEKMVFVAVRWKAKDEKD